MHPVRTQARALIEHEGHIALVRVRRKGLERWVLPGGGQDAGEPLQHTVRRECHEELGLHVDVGPLCLVREFVPQWTVATMARLVYNEPYRAARMTMAITDDAESLTARYTVQWSGKVHTLRAVGAKPAVRPAPGFTPRSRRGRAAAQGGRRLRFVPERDAGRAGHLSANRPHEPA